jgi:N-acetylmuramoyl-L-alanine amidase
MSETPNSSAIPASSASPPAPDVKPGNAEQPDDELSVHPVGQGEYLVKEGDDISSISVEKGFFWKTIWDDPGNQELKQERVDPNALFPGDRVTIPALKRKEESGATEMRHRFKRKGEPSKLRMKVMEEREPRKNEKYTLEVDGGPPNEGVTDADGKLEINIPGNARKGILKVGEGDKQLVYSLDLGCIYTIDSMAGIQQRLRNLEYYKGAVDGKRNPQTREALKKFQAKQGLPVNGKPDQATRDKLEEMHGC